MTEEQKKKQLIELLRVMRQYAHEAYMEQSTARGVFQWDAISKMIDNAQKLTGSAPSQATGGGCGGSLPGVDT